MGLIIQDTTPTLPNNPPHTEEAPLTSLAWTQVLSGQVFSPPVAPQRLQRRIRIQTLYRLPMQTVKHIDLLNSHITNQEDPAHQARLETMGSTSPSRRTTGL
jgi:hypothetical protein